LDVAAAKRVAAATVTVTTAAAPHRQSCNKSCRFEFIDAAKVEVDDVVPTNLRPFLTILRFSRFLEDDCTKAISDVALRVDTLLRFTVANRDNIRFLSVSRWWFSQCAERCQCNLFTREVIRRGVFCYSIRDSKIHIPYYTRESTDSLLMGAGRQDAYESSKNQREEDTLHFAHSVWDGGSSEGETRSKPLYLASGTTVQY
jgi:hypothetical protein